MVGNLIGLMVLVAVAVALGWLTWRARFIKNGILKWAAFVLGGLVTLVLALVCILIGMGFSLVYIPRGNPVQTLQVQATPDRIARGQHLAETLCVACHSTNTQVPLTGGRDMAADSPMPIGHFYSINLTPAGPLKDWSDGEIMRVLSDGVDRDGHPLLVMSSNGVRYLSDEDKQAVIAYLRSQPPIENQIPNPPDQPNLLIAAMAGAGIVQLRAPLAGAVTAPPMASTADYGKYIVAYGDCDTCHGADLSGGTDPVSPHGPNLRVVKGWTLDQFVTTMRTGKDPSGHLLSDMMPWKYIGRLNDVELGALYAYLHSLPSPAN